MTVRLARNVLVSGHGADPDAFNGARRAARHTTLAILTTTPDATDLVELRAHEALANVAIEIHGVDAADFAGALETADAVLDSYARDDVRVHVAGGPNLVTSALLLAAFRRGMEAFYCHARGISRLPIARHVDLSERFSQTDRAVLLALDPNFDTPMATIISATGLGAMAVKSSILRLRREGLLRATHESAALTATGAYYRNHFT